jgi:mono/diheme cytochrome c family protein
MKNRVFSIFASGAIAAGIGLGAAGLAGAADIRIPYQDRDAVGAGQSIYSDHCAACHGAALEGASNWRERDARGYLPAPPHDETGHTWHHADALLFAITKHGSEAVVGGGYRSDMIGFAGVLSDDEILSVLAFIKSTWPDRVIAIHNRINAEAGR